MIPARRLAMLTASGLAALAVAPARAHHGWVSYDADRLVTLTGTVIDSAWENPHGTLHLKVGERAWLVILAPPHRMANRGLPQTAIRPGGTVTVAGYASRTKADELRAERITTDDRTTELR